MIMNVGIISTKCAHFLKCTYNTNSLTCKDPFNVISNARSYEEQGGMKSHLILFQFTTFYLLLFRKVIEKMVENAQKLLKIINNTKHCSFILHIDLIKTKHID